MPTYTFNETSGTDNGALTSFAPTWPAARTGSALQVQTTGNDLQISGTLVGGTNYTVQRAYLGFGTVATLAGQVPSSASLRIYNASFSVFGGTGFIQLYTWTKTGAPPLGTSSWDKIGVAASSPVAISAIISAGSSGYDIPLNAAGVSFIKNLGTVPTRFAILASNDYTNTTPIDLGNGATIKYIGSGTSAVLTVTVPTPPTYTSVSPSNGPTSGGTAFTVTGTNFEIGMTIVIGGVAATSIVVTSSTTATGVTGQHPAVGLCNIVLTNPDSGTAIGTNQYTYDAGVPVLGSITPVQGTTAGGTACTIIGSGFASGGSPANSVTFGGSSATSVVVVSDSVITCVSPAHAAGAVNVVVNNPNSAGSDTLVAGFLYYITPPATAAGSQLIYDFTRGIWYSASYGHLQSIISLPISGVPFSMALDTSGNVNYVLSDDSSAVSHSTLPIGRGFLQTEPISFGNSKTLKMFDAVRFVVNDITAITASGGVTDPWLCYVYIDQGAPTNVTLQVNAIPYNRFPIGTLEGTHVGELIGYIAQDIGGVVTGHSIRVELYYPAGTPANTPTLGVTGGQPNHLPWAVYQIDIVASLVDQSKVEP